MAANPRDILLRPIITEKTSAMMQDNKYTFKVALGANKVEIRQAIEEIFKVFQISVNQMDERYRESLFCENLEKHLQYDSPSA